MPPSVVDLRGDAGVAAAATSAEAGDGGIQTSLDHLGFLPTPQVTDPWSVEKVLATTGEQPSKSSVSPVPYFHLLERLKTVKREGWRRFAINR